jgi:hypothetical protein
MKIGIITFHQAENYGAVLQALALQNVISNILQDSDVYIVNYTSKSISNSYRVLFPFYEKKTFLLKIRSLIGIIIQLPFTLKRKLVFYLFRKKYINFINIDSINDCDYLICGSDQIWNPSLTDGIDRYYYGDINGFHGRIITYAASDGGQLKNYDKDLLSTLFNNIYAISVRESSMISRIREYTNKNVVTVMDPVFLPDHDFWDFISSDIRRKGYILIYQLEYNPIILKEAKELALKTGKYIIDLCYNYPLGRKWIFSKTYKIKIAVSPSKFISYFKNADYILTNSFHGTAFSIIFKKQFCTYNIEKRNERLIDLLSFAGLSDRYVSSGLDVITEKINYDKIYKRIDEKIKFSYDFLITSLIRE